MTDAKFKIKADNKTRSAFESANKDLKNLDDRGRSLSNRFSLLNTKTLAYSASVAALSTITTSSVRKFAEFEQQMFRIESLLQATGNASGLTADEIGEMARRIGKDTLASAGDVRAASGIVLTFKSITSGTFEKVLELSQDLAAVMGTNIRSSALQLSKALEDPVRGLTALRRSGVSFTESQQEMIKTMVESGHQSRAQGFILETLSKQIGGAGKGEGKGLAGSIDLVTENWSRFLEITAKTSGVVSIVDKSMRGWAWALDKVSNYLSQSEEERALKLFKERIELTKKLKSLEKQGRYTGYIQKRIDLIGKEITVLNDKRMEEAKSSVAAREASRSHQQKLQLESQQRQSAAKEQKLQIVKDELAKEEELRRQFSDRIAEVETSRLQLGFNRLQSSFMTRSERLKESEKNDLFILEQSFQAGLISHATYEESKTKLEKRNRAMRNAATLDAVRSSLSDITMLTSSKNEKLFAIGKAASISQALINTYLGVTKTMTDVPYPFNVPLAAAQSAAGMVQVQNIRSQQFRGAREHGGPVVSGNNGGYLVGERGPEIFRPNTSGQIISNKNISNAGDQNVSVIINSHPDAQILQWVEDNQSTIFNVVLNAMRENDLNFS